MAFKVHFPTLALAFLLLFVFQVCCFEVVGGPGKMIPSPNGGNGWVFPMPDCGKLCGVRCSKHSRPNLCKRACGTCCFRCKCVPPGTYGNREVCGSCYVNMTTHHNKPKCP
ncbi:gibberellin-regulated protein 14-like [Dioscorea cayenensis subsp. rotundata]|uniref:Gibberellin-regulated protein 14-like n=1 Tax=Dioscorea cayennensis subsp. rotundata TaxID=55577 RepID=A0AB40BVD1_DIOCR|nr:gibberellin-regulated protein 14-like [Dioscorea cayenensis subsp. rotundata]